MLFTNFAWKTHMGLDDELDVGSANAIGESPPIGEFEQRAKVWDGNVVTIDRIRSGNSCAALIRDFVDDQLMAKHVEVDPVLSTSTLGKSQHVSVERASFVDLVDGNGEMKARTWHETIVAR